jgi:hypothetical protein
MKNKHTYGYCFNFLNFRRISLLLANISALGLSSIRCGVSAHGDTSNSAMTLAIAVFTAMRPNPLPEI